MEQSGIESFRDIIGYESHYEISNLGRVRNKRTGRFIVTKQGKLGYPKVNLWKSNKYKTILIHRLIGIHFIPNPLNYKEINHIDGNRTNNSIENLEWVSRKQNCIHAVETGLVPLGQARRNSKLTNAQAMEIYKLSHSGTMKRQEIANMFQISTTQVSQIKNKREWRHIHSE